MSTTLRATIDQTCWAVRPPAGRGPRRSEMPKATSIEGTAIPPSRSMGAPIARGRVIPKTAMSRPATAPIVIGLRVIVRSARPTRTRSPRPSLSNRAIATGVMTSSCMSSVGATQATSPST